MKIGVPKEIKNHEYRVGLAPRTAREVIAQGHSVIVQSGAGEGIGVTDEDYVAVGAQLVANAQEVFEQADMIVKVKEPQSEECHMLREGQILFTYLHLAPDPKQAQLLCDSGCIAIAYETVTDDHGGLPLLSPMSEVAGRMSIQAGAHCLEKAQGGRGVLLGGVPGVEAAHVVVIGGGVVGTNAVRMAMGMEAEVTVLDRSLRRLKELDLQFGSKINTIYATLGAIEHYVLEADLVVGAVLVPGAAAPKLVTRELLSRMKAGAVIVDVAIDQGGCFETSRPTTHTEPTYTLDGIVHYCVTNMPGAVPRTATFALNNATLPFILDIANNGYKAALLEDQNLLNGLNVYRGGLTHLAVARDLQQNYLPAREALAN
jgi:alanine dehydrogenase